MKPFRLFLLFVGISRASCAFAQQFDTTAEIHIAAFPSGNEFSGLAKWRDKILFIPQHKKIEDSYVIIAVDTLSIDSVINGQLPTLTRYTAFEYDTVLGKMYQQMDDRNNHKPYGGFEAAAVIGDSIFLTVETDSLCFVIKGLIQQTAGSKWQVRFDAQHILALPKPNYGFANAGYESLGYLKKQNRLVAIYENNELKDTATAFSFTTGFTDVQPVKFSKPLLFRMTDVSEISGAGKDDSLIALNHSYRGDTAEVNYYSGYNKAADDAEMHADAYKQSFTRILGLGIHNNTINWKVKKVINYANDNWEGLVPYKRGVLLVVDGNNSKKYNCKLSYFELN